MPAEESRYPGDWLRIAEKDLGRVQHLLAVHDAAAAGFFLQQGIEKSLKAFLLGRGWNLERIHDLEALLNRALAHDPSLEKFRAVCQKITAYYLLERYPRLTQDAVTEEDVRTSLENVQALIEYLRSEITKGP